MATTYFGLNPQLDGFYENCLTGSAAAVVKLTVLIQ